MHYVKKNLGLTSMVLDWCFMNLKVIKGYKNTINND